ncbi:conserved hypothetical protein [Ricinus communis]|uniref:RecQ mediated genome instability protein 1 OB-fold domain-containing protein n=1 Tax=Ricinus communis TaxID=3988 RepID=B9RP92_RICCO|nr:conserved hypothetical protein [Ricinus communis]
MEGEGTEKVAQVVIQTLRTRGWCFDDGSNQLKSLIVIQSALADDTNDATSIANSVESKLLNLDLKSFGAKSLPDRDLLRNNTSHLQGPKVLQISSVRDISVSSIDGFSDSSNRRLLRFTLTDGYNEITAIEYSHIPSIPNDVVPGTKVRLENKVPIQNGIICLNPKVITLIGGAVQSLYEEWQMKQKYLSSFHSSIRLSQEADSGPPQFEKLQIGAAFRCSSQHADCLESTSKSSVLAGNTDIRSIDMQQNAADLDDKVTTTSLSEKVEQKSSKSNTRVKEVAESVPVQNQAAAQKLLQKMNIPSQADRYSRGRKHKGRNKQEELQVFTLDEWEKRKAGAKPPMRNNFPDTSCDEDLAWQLQNQLDMEHSQDLQVQTGMHNNVTDDIRMNMCKVSST